MDSPTTDSFVSSSCRVSLSVNPLLEQLTGERKTSTCSSLTQTPRCLGRTKPRPQAVTSYHSGHFDLIPEYPSSLLPFNIIPEYFSSPLSSGAVSVPGAASMLPQPVSGRSGDRETNTNALVPIGIHTLKVGEPRGNRSRRRRRRRRRWREHWGPKRRSKWGGHSKKRIIGARRDIAEASRGRLKSGNSRQEEVEEAEEGAKREKEEVDTWR